MGRWPTRRRKTRLIEVLEDTGTKTLRYLYDFGDGWEHTIKIERLLNPMPSVDYPVPSGPQDGAHPKTSVARSATPSFSKRSQARSMSAMLSSPNGTTFDPNHLDFEAVNEEIEALAKKWARKPRPKKTRPA